MAAPQLQPGSAAPARRGSAATKAAQQHRQRGVVTLQLQQEIFSCVRCHLRRIAKKQLHYCTLF